MHNITMLKKLMIKIMRKKHFWRHVEFDELSEIYVSMMFRSMAISLSGLFIPLYLLQLGFGVTSILMLFGVYFTVRAAVFDMASAYMTAWYGPKHVISLGYILLLGSTSMFLTLPMFGWPLWLIGVVWGGSASFFFIPFDVDFSKIKHREHGGKELGFVVIMERAGGVLGPLCGGVIASLFGGQALFLVAATLLLVGLIPLMMSGESVKTRQKLDFKSLSLDGLKRDIFSNVFTGLENTLTICAWPLYLGLFVLSGKESAYAGLGFLASISVFVSMFAAYKIGSLIDNRHGRKLLRISTVLNALLHLARGLVSAFPLATLLNVANEIVTVGYRMPYIKGKYDKADDLPGHRIVYFASLEVISSTVKAFVWLLLALISTITSNYSVMVVSFVIAAVSSILISTERYKALD
jgi:MFS family permease